MIEKRETLLDYVIRTTGEDIRNCYQCGKCSAGCPTSPDMTHPPNVVMRIVQFDMWEELMNGNSTWMCVSCTTCTARCPREIDVSGTIESLRRLIVVEQSKAQFRVGRAARILGQHARSGAKTALDMTPRENVKVFSSAFLENIRRFGRSFEVGLVANYNLNSGYLFCSMMKGPVMFVRGKLGLIPKEVKRVERKEMIRRIFEKTEEKEGVNI